MMRFRNIVGFVLVVIMVFGIIFVGNIETKMARAITHEEFSLSSLEFTQQINIGWNNGNSMDSMSPAGGSETAWGNPVVTPELFEAIKTKGYNTIRIPVTWTGRRANTNTTMGPAPDYKITDAWMNRVAEVVDYAYELDLFVIINIHHDGVINASDTGCWLTTAGEAAEFDRVLDQFSKVWTQIATKFKDYGEKLIFEGMNEVEGGSNVRINELNQKFVDTVRATGGNNDKRYLIFKTYYAMGRLGDIYVVTVPEDPANHVILGVHYYSTYEYCYATAPRSVDYINILWLKNQMAVVYKALQQKFINNGLGVIIGEFGPCDKNNTESRTEYVDAFVYQAKEYGLRCIWWDNGEFTGDAFGLINRNTFEWVFGGIADSMIAAANKEVVPMTTVPTTVTTTVKTTASITVSEITSIIKKGDINGDGKITGMDLLLMKQHILTIPDKTIEPDTNAFKAADMNDDNKINGMDLLLLKKAILS